MEDWQTNHRARETRLQELDAQADRKFGDLNKREVGVTELEQKAKLQQRELSEREQRLQVQFRDLRGEE